MQTLRLDNNLLMLMEPCNGKVRLVVCNGETELTCRKETPGNLRHFVTGGNGSLFKGRLQLHKFDGNVTVTLKRDPLGKVPLDDMALAFNAAFV